MTKKVKNKKGQSDGGSKGEELRDKISEVDKEWFGIQIKSLEEKLERRVQTINSLEINNKDLTEKYHQLREDKVDVVAYLKRMLNQRTDQIGELQARLVGLQSVHSADAEHYKTKITDLEAEFSHSKQQMESDNMVLTKKLDALEEFRIQREQLMNKFEDQNKKMDDQKSEYENQIYSIERNHIIEQDRLKKDMMSKLENIASEFRKASHAQMAATTQRTIRENVNLSAQVFQLSDRVSSVTKKCSTQDSQLWKKEQHSQLLLKEKEKLIKQNTYRLKVIEDLSKKVKEQKKQLAQLNSFYEERREFESKLATNAAEIECLKTQLKATSVAYKEQEESVTHMESTLHNVSELKNSVNECLHQANETIKSALYMSTEHAQDEEGNEEFTRQRVLNQLLALLNEAIHHHPNGQSPSRIEQMRISFKNEASFDDDRHDIDYVQGSLGLVPE
ncbi:cilia- and flagella-associated protein 157 [Lepeophtheirus salmonis]|uniref:cilia- and flagella-associated protein 157 n=1 Tax=Lepeophtheirus salmonis TaxID=72036 RepID=UPI00077F7C4A|nr:cilia- and flagella-associated protein 157-like [Lepeophtheirus salmonis]